MITIRQKTRSLVKAMPSIGFLSQVGIGAIAYEMGSMFLRLISKERNVTPIIVYKRQRDFPKPNEIVL